MATFIKRGGKYQVVIRRKGFPTSCRSFHLKSDAEEWARHMDTKADRGDLPTSTKVLGSVKVKDVIRRYIDEITSQKRSEDSEGYLLEAFLRQPIANLTLAQITPSHFSTYRDKRLKYVKAGTVIKKSPLKHWIVTYDNVQEINEIYDLKNKVVYNLRYSVSHTSPTGSEVLFHSAHIKLPYKQITNA